MLNVEKFVEGLHDYIGRAISPIVERLAALEARAPEKGDPGADGKDGRDGVDGKSVTIEEVTPILREWFDAIPQPKDGRDGVDGKDGKNVTVDEVLPVLRSEVMDTLRMWFDEMPRPKDGVDGKDGCDGKDGRDGIDGKSVTLDDVRPMLEGELAKWALDFERRAQDVLQRAIDRMPAPKDGRDGINGKDGRDAFQLEDIELSVADDDRTLTLAFVREGARVERSIRLNHPIYRGIWKEGAYEKGDCVTFGGSAFIATRETTSKPETDDSWKLCVKRGRDGKDGAKGEKGERGERGPKGEPPAELQTGKIR